MLQDINELREDIDRFIKYFHGRLEIIRNTDFKDANNLFKKILYSGLIDALSKTTSNSKKENRERIVVFVKNFCNWSTCERISLPHLVRLLQKVPDPEFSELRAYAFSLLDKWGEGEVISLNFDPNLQEIKKYWPKDIPKPLQDIQIDFLQHVNLFYRLRNSLVHELRKQGYGAEFPNDAEPFYSSMTDLETNQKTWELVYPIKFYDNLCISALKNLKTYYLKDRINPYSCYTYGTYWIEELNQ